MENEKSSLRTDKGTDISVSAHYSVINEGVSVFPTPHGTMSSTGGSKNKLMKDKVRSFSLFDVLEERDPLLNPEKSGSTDNFSPDEGLQTVTSIPNLCRPSRKHRKLNTLLLEAMKHHDVLEIERLIKAGANPNATCCMDCISVCHLAALRSDDALTLLLSFGAEIQRSDRLGRTPLHLAAWAGNVRQIAILLGFSKDLQNRLEAEDIALTIEEEVKNLSPYVKELVNVKCDFGMGNSKLPKDWKDNAIDHNCKEFEKSLPLFQPGWTALHAASARAQSRSASLLLAAGADPCARDLVGRTPLDIAGSAYYTNHSIDPNKFAEIVTMLVKRDCKLFTNKNRKIVDTPLHTAVEVGSLEAVTVLAAANIPVNWLNRAGLSPLHICVKKKLKEHLQTLISHGINDANISTAVDIKDKDGHTVLHEAIMESWRPGVSVAIEAGANIIAKDNNGETPIHLAAMKGNVDILTEVLNIAKEKNVIDIINKERETALFKAIFNGHTQCVRKLLKEGASITKTLPRKVNVMHVAAEKGYVDVLTVLLDHNYTITREIINHLTTDDKKGFGPLHFAVQNNHSLCVKILLSRNAYRSLRASYGLQKGSTPLHIAAMNNNVEIAKIITFQNEDTVHNINDLGWTPLHTASHYGSRDMITLLLQTGADLSHSTTSGPNKTTAINMIMNNLSKPTEFMETIFDSFIRTNDRNLQDPNCEVTVIYKVLVPKSEENEQIKVIEALLKTGDRYNQRRLLVHPLVESFLYLKWKALLPFFYTMMGLYALFVLSLTTFIITVFFYKDTENATPIIFNSTGWAIVLYLTVCLIVAQEILYMNVKNGYFIQLETWVKFGSVCLAVILPYATSEVFLTSDDWPRHVATGALLLSWVEMMFLLSRFPNWGYYVLMFGKVSANVIKILLTFAFLVIGFSLSFMIQFHSKAPFESPWAALVKTMVMMTSEFDYDDLVKESESNVKSLFVIRLIFFVFLILAAIVLMNLMVGVAVNDLHNLQVLGNIRRLAKQVEFLGSLENLVYNRIFKKILPNWLENMLHNKKKILKNFVLRPSVPKSKSNKSLPSHIREAIFEKAQLQKKQMEDELGTQNYKMKLEEIYEATVKKNKESMLAANEACGPVCIRTKANNNILVKQIVDLQNALTDVKAHNNLSIKQMKSSIEELNIKMDIILSKIENNCSR